jgi:hypothetical protein
MHDPREPHLTAMKCILHYLQGTPDYGLLLRHSSSPDLVIYMDADWTSCPDTRCSMSGYAVFLGDNLVYWSVKRQRPLGCVSCSTSSRPCHLGAHLSIAIISTPCTYPPATFSINAPSMWRLIFILSERRLPSVKSRSSMFRRHHSSPTSS